MLSQRGIDPAVLSWVLVVFASKKDGTLKILCEIVKIEVGNCERYVSHYKDE